MLENAIFLEVLAAPLTGDFALLSSAIRFLGDLLRRDLTESIRLPPTALGIERDVALSFIA